MLSLLGTLAFGVSLGLSAGLAPGPLTALVLSESLRSGLGAGLRVACAPLLTDTPIIVVAILAVGSVASSQLILGFIGLAGGLYLVYLALETLGIERIETNAAGPDAGALRRGVIANFLNPHPYIFWFTVGAPTIVKGYGEGPAGPAAFLLGFYLMLVGSKAVLAWLAARYRGALSGTAYRRVMRALAAALLVFGALLLHSGVAALGSRL